MAINLLPEYEKKKFKQKENFKKFFLILIYILIFFLVLILILYSLKIYISFKIESLQKLVLEKEKEFEEKYFRSFEKEIEQINENLLKIKKFEEREILIIPILEKISSLIPDSIYLTNLSFQKISQQEEEGRIKIFAEIHITGWASNREDLFYFRKALEEEKDFRNVYFSLSSWVKPRNIDFSLSFKTYEFFSR